MKIRKAILAAIVTLMLIYWSAVVRGIITINNEMHNVLEVKE